MDGTEDDMGALNALYGRFPTVEVACRHVYSRVKKFDFVKKNKAVRKAKDALMGRPAREEGGRSWENYCKYIEGLGIKNGDILIVHSSMDGLRKMDVGKEEAVGFLRDLVGPDGTLVMPAYPAFKKKPVRVSFDEEIEEARKYNPDKTIAWTGILPNYLCTLEGARRSLFPIDTLAAIGRDADAMMEGNLNGRISHGKLTAWDYCYQRHARVLYFGIGPAYCISELHVYEDMNPEEWPIKGWYKSQKFFITNGNETTEFTCRARKIFWDQYMTTNYGIARLIKNGLMRFDNVEDTPIGFLPDLYAMTDFVGESVKKKGDLLFWKIPRKYWK